jgi:hypothetical protein
MPFLYLLRLAAPYVSIACVIALVWAHGYYTADKHRIEREAQTAAQSILILETATKRNAQIMAQATESAQIIGEAYGANRQTITDLTNTNRALLERLRQQPGANCRASGVPETTTATIGGDAPDPGNREFFQSVIDRAEIADEVAETARACQNYVTEIEGLLNETRH